MLGNDRSIRADYTNAGRGRAVATLLVEIEVPPKGRVAAVARLSGVVGDERNTSRLGKGRPRLTAGLRGDVEDGVVRLGQCAGHARAWIGTGKDVGLIVNALRVRHGAGTGGVHVRGSEGQQDRHAGRQGDREKLVLHRRFLILPCLVRVAVNVRVLFP